MPVRNESFLSLAAISAILLIWMLISIKQFSFNYITNEVDILPSAKQFVERKWLPNDWYLNLDIDYRQPFNLGLGALVSWLGLQYGAYAGRLLVYLLLAVSIYTLFRAFGLRISFGLLVFLFFLDHQSLITGEWIVGGVDFRFPDVMVPFMIAVLVAIVVNDIADGRLKIPSLPHSLQNRMRLILSRGGAKLLALATILIVLQSTDRLRTETRNTRPVLEWIADNTPKQAIFLVYPAIADFYIYAQRAMFVSFRHSPQSAADILEWYKRIKLCNGNRPASKSGFRSIKEIQTNFYNLDEDLIRQIARPYGISYYLGSSQKGLTFDRAYSNGHFTVYKVNETDKALTGGGICE